MRGIFGGSVFLPIMHRLAYFIYFLLFRQNLTKQCRYLIVFASESIAACTRSIDFRVSDRGHIVAGWRNLISNVYVARCGEHYACYPFCAICHSCGRPRRTTEVRNASPAHAATYEWCEGPSFGWAYQSKITAKVKREHRKFWSWFLMTVIPGWQ